MQPTLHRPERRRRDLRGRVARVTYPMRHAVGQFIDRLPCNIIGHRWVEESRGGRRRGDKNKKMRFKCSRCNLHAGFTN